MGITRTVFVELSRDQLRERVRSQVSVLRENGSCLRCIVGLASRIRAPAVAKKAEEALDIGLLRRKLL